MLKEKEYLLLCPKCKDHIPSIRLIPFNFNTLPVQIQIICECQKLKPFLVPLIQFVKEAKATQSISLSNKCNQHQLEKTSHCNTCNTDFCSSCRSNHKSHKTIDISTYAKQAQNQLSFSNQKAYLDYSRGYIKTIMDTKEKIIGKINIEVNQILKLKMKVENDFMKYEEINNQLISFFGTIYQNYLENKNNYVLIDNLIKNSLFSTPKFKFDANAKLESEISRWTKFNEDNFFLAFNKYRSLPVSTMTLVDHASYIKTVGKLSNQYIISGSGDRSINIWDRFSCEVAHKLIGHNDCVNKVLVINNDVLLSCSGDHTMMLWDLRTFQKINTIHHFDSGLWACIQLRNGTIAVGSVNREVKLFSYPSFKHKFTLMAHSSSVWTIRELQDGRLVSADHKGAINVWNLTTRSLITSLTNHKEGVWDLIQLRNERLISGSNDKTIRVWDVYSFKCLKTIKEHSGYIFSLLELQDGSFASGSGDLTIKIWNENTYACLYTLTGHTGCPNALVQFDDGTLASGSDDQTLRIWE